jgi:hypothetical protein
VKTPIVIGLSAVIVAMREGEAAILTLRSAEGSDALPFGPFDPDGRPTFELALRDFVRRQTDFDLGYVEQLYTFGDKGRDAPLADVGAGAARVISVGYLALAPEARDAPAAGSAWTGWTRYFPYEDWRAGRPALIDQVIAPALQSWVGSSNVRRARADLAFALDGGRWNEERVLERYELLYEAGLVPEARRDRGQDAQDLPWLGAPMLSDHRRILATALGRLRGKLKYRPVIFELMGPAFTLSALQRAVEAIAGVALHKQNFRRVVERTDLVEPLGRRETETGGRPAELYRFRREELAARSAPGLSLPLLRD